MVHQSRHPDINGYVRRVLGNTKPLMEAGIVDDLVMAFSPEDANSQEPKERITFSCSALSMITSSDNISMRFDDKVLANLEEHMKHSLTNLLKLPKFSEVEPWKFELHLRTSKSSRGVYPNQDNTLKNALRSNEWKVDDDANTGPSPSQGSRGDDISSSSLIGISSFRNELFNCSINRVRESR